MTTRIGKLTKFFSLPSDDFERIVSILNFLFLTFEKPDESILLSVMEKGPLYRDMITLSSNERASLQLLVDRVYKMFSEFSSFVVLPCYVGVVSLDAASSFLSITSILESIETYVKENNIPLSVLFRSSVQLSNKNGITAYEPSEYFAVNLNPKCHSATILTQNGDVQYLFTYSVQDIISFAKEVLRLYCKSLSVMSSLDMCCFSSKENSSMEYQTISFLNRLRRSEMTKTIISLRKKIAEGHFDKYSSVYHRKVQVVGESLSPAFLSQSANDARVDFHLMESELRIKKAVDKMKTDDIWISDVNNFESHLDNISSGYCGVFDTEKWTTRSPTSSFQRFQNTPTESQYSPSNKTLEIVDLLNSFTESVQNTRFTPTKR
jgi:hypothetical protein